MSTMKRFGKYAIWIILFWIFSELLINIGLKTTYKDLKKVGEIPTGIQVVEMKATAVNGKVKLIANSTYLSNKYIKINLYSGRDILLGTQYLEIGNIGEGQSKEIDTYFKISEVEKYEINIEDVKGESSEGFMDTALSAITILIAVIELIIVL